MKGTTETGNNYRVDGDYSTGSLKLAQENFETEWENKYLLREIKQNSNSAQQ